MDLKEILINTRNCVDSAQGRECPCEYGIEPPGSIRHGVSESFANYTSYKVVSYILEIISQKTIYCSIRGN